EAPASHFRRDHDPAVDGFALHVSGPRETFGHGRSSNGTIRRSRRGAAMRGEQPSVTLSMRSMKRTVLLALVAATLVGCGRDDIVQNLGPELLYERGEEMMQAGNYQGAVAYFQQLEASYPFIPLTRQAQLDVIYAYYKAGLREEAIAAA